MKSDFGYGTLIAMCVGSDISSRQQWIPTWPRQLWLTVRGHRDLQVQGSMGRNGHSGPCGTGTILKTSGGELICRPEGLEVKAMTKKRSSRRRTMPDNAIGDASTPSDQSLTRWSPFAMIFWSSRLSRPIFDKDTLRSTVEVSRKIPDSKFHDSYLTKPQGYSSMNLLAKTCYLKIWAHCLPLSPGMLIDHTRGPPWSFYWPKFQPNKISIRPIWQLFCHHRSNTLHLLNSTQCQPKSWAAAASVIFFWQSFFLSCFVTWAAVPTAAVLFPS